MRNPAHGKGHEEGGLAYAKVGASLRGPLEILKHLPPKPESAYLTTIFLFSTFQLHRLTYSQVPKDMEAWGQSLTQQ